MADAGEQQTSTSHEQEGFTRAIAAWRSKDTDVNVVEIHTLTVSIDINLTSLIPNLDNTASEIVAYQRDSTVQRKELAQKTKDFRKLDDASKLVEYKALLKGGRIYGYWREQTNTLLQHTSHSLILSQIMPKVRTQLSYKFILHYQKLLIRIRSLKPPWTRCYSPKIHSQRSHPRMSICKRRSASWQHSLRILRRDWKRNEMRESNLRREWRLKSRMSNQPGRLY